jgi:ubiquinone/menaquinone biosynthesis C-methylase UbiE
LRLRLDRRKRHPETMASGTHGQAWEDWGEVDPLFAILTEPKYRNGGGDVNEFLQGGQGAVRDLLEQTDQLKIGTARDSALDFGCGVGRLTGGLADHFRRVVGVDVAPSMLDTARTLHAERDNCEFALNQANDLRWIPDASFDFVLCLLVLQHLDSTASMEMFLREFVRVLRPGGAIVVQLPSSVPAHRIPLPSWRTRRGLQVRTARLLRRVGVPAKVLYRRFDWVPQMTLLALPDERTRKILEDAGGRIVHVTPAAADSGGTIDRTYFVTR